MAATLAAAPVVSIGANFAGSNLGVSGVNPPDSDGAVGPRQFVEFVNGAYNVYAKSGAVLQHLSLTQFWSSAGVTPSFPVDPRILYDPESQRWFAAAVDISAGSGANPAAFLLAVSNTADPTQGWKAFEFGQTFDFTELGLNKDGVYLTATNGAGGNIDLVSIPKADLLAAAPTIAHATALQTFFANAGPAPQPAVAPELSGSEPIVGVFPDFVKISSIDSPTAAPTLNITDRAVPVPEGLQNFGAMQKGATVPVNTGNLVLSSSVVMQGDKLFGVETIAANPDQTHPELRWFEIGNPLTAPVLLASGVISPPGLEVYCGSIAVNPLGEVVIGFSGSGPDTYPSAYAVAGTLNGDALQLGDPMLLKAGVAPETSGRFGDYSTTTYDPTDPSHFWTVQEWTSASGWSTQISEITFNSPPPPPPPPSPPPPPPAGVTLQASAGQTSLVGGAGDDTLSGWSGSATLFGGDGNDSISGGLGFNRVNGNKGDDTIIGHSASGDWLLGGQGNDLIDASGSTGNNIINGNLGNDTVTGGAGADVLRGGQGDDVIHAGAGNPWIAGDLGNNTIYGGQGLDTFRAGSGHDLINGWHAGDQVQVASGVTWTTAQVNGAVHITFSSGGEMDLLNTQLSSLQPGWIVSA
jgi:hypothetical protein